MNDQELEVLKVLAQFLNRVDLKGSEVQAFVACSNYINERLNMLDPSQTGAGAPAPLPEVDED